MLVHIRKIIKAAEKGKYAVGAFNVNNLETVLAIIQAAEEEKSPVIIQVTEGAIKYAGLKEIAALIRAAAEEASVPVALHLDHGKSLETVKKCIAENFSSVMIDASAFKMAKNIRLTKKVVQYAHGKKVWVQAELGRLGGLEDFVKVSKEESFLTEPEEAKQFIKETNIDTFAPAIGNYHGVQKMFAKKKLKLDLKRLAEIAKIIKIPMVLHGASGFSGDQIKKAVKLGIRAINIDSELRVSFANTERAFLKKNKSVYDPRKILQPAIEEMKKTVKKKIRIFGSKNKA